MRQSNNPVLLFCQDIDGHRQVYVAVIGKWFLSMGYSVVIALTDTEDGANPIDAPVLGQLLTNQHVHLIELGNAKQDKGIPGFWVSRLRKIEDEVQPDWTILVVGDQCRQTLCGLGDAGRPFMTRRAGIFIYVNHEYLPDLRGKSALRKMRSYLRWWLSRRNERSYFSKNVWRKLGLDKILTTNEDFWRSVDNKHINFIPEIYQAWGFDLPADDPIIERLRQDYHAFLIRNPYRDVILYYGTRFARRGYDILLALSRDHADTVFVSCGRDAGGQAFAHDIASLRSQIKSEGRLFEVDLPFLPENSLTDDLFLSAHYVLLPYRQWYGMSGSLFQAVSYGKPVLVPDIGHMSSMVKRYGIGLTYAAVDEIDFINKFEIIRREGHKYIPATKEFASKHNQSQLSAALEKSFTT
jgi:glycosyltransferase involved in cell wall biosynthesis